MVRPRRRRWRRSRAAGLAGICLSRELLQLRGAGIPQRPRQAPRARRPGRGADSSGDAVDGSHEDDGSLGPLLSRLRRELPCALGPAGTSARGSGTRARGQRQAGPAEGLSGREPAARTSMGGRAGRQAPRSTRRAHGRRPQASDPSCPSAPTRAGLRPQRPPFLPAGTGGASGHRRQLVLSPSEPVAPNDDGRPSPDLRSHRCHPYVDSEARPGRASDLPKATRPQVATLGRGLPSAGAAAGARGRGGASLLGLCLPTPATPSSRQAPPPMRRRAPRPEWVASSPLPWEVDTFAS